MVDGVDTDGSVGGGIWNDGRMRCFAAVFVLVVLLLLVLLLVLLLLCNEGLLFAEAGGLVCRRSCFSRRGCFEEEGVSVVFVRGGDIWEG